VNIKLTIEYDGTRYHGWQIQSTGETIQSVLEKAVSIFFGKPTRIIGSGRTDAGVHALGQVANFFCDQEPDPHRLQRGLNALTPEDITIKEVTMVPDCLEGGRGGRRRVCEYGVLNRSTPSPFHLNRAWHVHDPLDVQSMREPTRRLEGKHDFSAFQAAGCDAIHPIRQIYPPSRDDRNELHVYTTDATAFLRHTVRNIGGPVREIARKQRTPESFAELLRVRDRTKAGATAPAHGLFLIEVKY